MANGTNTPPNFLYNLRFKINTPDGGLNWKLSFAEMTEVNALAASIDIANRLRALMPSTCEIYAATISKSNRTKDSRFIPGCIGSGQYLQSGMSPAATVYNHFTDAILVRFEDSDGQGVSMKIGPVPDTIITNGQIPLPITGVTDATVAPAALGAQPITYATEFTQLMQAIAKNCAKIVSKNNIPGGTYNYSAFTKANVKRVCKKKGGRVFVK